MRIYDTARRDKVELAPGPGGAITIYNCGPTVYDHAHVGHARNMLVFDVLRRYLRWRGYAVRYVMNYTDIDDKVIVRAQQEGRPASEITERYIASIETDMRRLGIEAPDVTARATEHIPEMIAMIDALIANGHAYPAGGDVYFAVDTFPKYGALSGRRIEDLRAGARVEPSEHKRNPLDFALWKGAKPGEPVWESPWGPGRPGWHIECSVMSERYLGVPFDIHGGGTDLVFPHHENEKAQSEAAHGFDTEFARFWMHNGFVNLNGEKMSKSTGNYVTLRQLLDELGGGAVRMLALQSHYRRDIDFAPSLVEEAAVAHRRLSGVRRHLAEAAGLAEPKPSEPIAREPFMAAMDDDLNTAAAVAAVFELTKAANVAMERGAEPGEAAALLQEFDELTGVLGLSLHGELGDDARLVDGVVALLLDVRARARERKDWAEADAIRDGLSALGIAIEDSPDGTRWHRGGMGG